MLIIWFHPNTTHLLLGYLYTHSFFGVPSNLLQGLLPNERTLGQNGHFYGLWISSSSSSKQREMVDEKIVLPEVKLVRVLWCKIAEQSA